MPVSDVIHGRTRIRAVRNRNGATGRRLRAVVAGCAALIVAGCGGTADDSASIVRTTTNIAGAGVVGLERDTTRACALPSAPDPAGGATRSVTHAAGVSEVPADPQRIVVLSTAALDAVCALGLWERVVGTVTIDGPSPQPAYLGTGVLKIPGVGTAAQPDPARIADLRPDLILGENSTGAASFSALQAIAPTVLVGSNNGWQAEFAAYAAGLARREAAETALRDYRTEANDTGTALAAAQTQASVIRFTADTDRVQGRDSFSGQVLGDAGVQRPEAQRGTSFDVREDEFATKVEGDVIYVILAGPEGKKHGETVLRSDEWKELGAATDRRVFAVEDSVWHGDGLTAARALLTDLRNTLNGYVTD
ncbi:ABC transporter substrate-binding protein [Nocardia abscessus]|uniref:ABC transporter substrate-binding protein n=1 Tax=Nocardia abscessus TaxID=120957 RepID=UPI002457E9F0|nr:ABC transporter substrate-binding protein [Nocardia abscessus]